jgi:hypothetical protein
MEEGGNMLKSDPIIIQNVIGRITHGMIGFDLLIQGKANNQYLEDFLSLKEEELKSALASASANTGFVPLPIEGIKEVAELISVVQRAQQLAKRVNEADPETIKQIIAELEAKLDILYGGVMQR